MPEWHDFRLLNIYVELPDNEAKKTGLCQEGKVERMTSSRRWKEVAKGKGKERSSLGPPALFEVQVKPEHVALAGALDWRLEDVAGDGRSMMLIFDTVILKFSFGLHTSPQWLTQEMWQQSVLPTTGKQRGYKVALAFEFKARVLAFLSHDLLFQVKWVTRRQSPGLSLTEAHPDLASVDVYADFGTFLEAVVQWIVRRRATCGRTGYVVDVLRKDEAAKVWVGVGVYTASEICYIAGISPFLTEREVFDCASRSARLANAFWQFAYDAQDLYTSVIRPCMVDDVLAPGKDQRNLYSRYLSVFKKQKVNVTVRMAKAIDAFKDRLAILAERTSSLRDSRDNRERQPDDPFEPSLMANALLLGTCHPKFKDRDRTTTTSDHECADCRRFPCDKANKGFSLGRLIYGSKPWEEQAPADLLEFEKPDVMTKMFDKAVSQGLITYRDRHRTFLPEYKPQSIIVPDAKAINRPKRPIYHHRIDDKLNVYSVVPDYPRNCYANAEDRKSKQIPPGFLVPPSARVVAVPRDNSKKASLKEMIDTDGLVAIGPLEYCGNGKPVKHRGRVRVSLVKDGDPRFLSSSSTFFVERSARQQVATKAERLVAQKKALQDKKIKTAIAKGKVPKAHPVNVAKERVKARELVKKEIDAKVAGIKQSKAAHLDGRRSIASISPVPKPSLPPNALPCRSSSPGPVINRAPDPQEESFL
ncbi:hypothetical protein FA13DRAFT_1797588 [Coprinellus micaceus]|uniref:Uncharacterized protein n=1 Tax=Coprinellus micaceus TaxID=71717 RepID=A0A4Y7SQ97_COPMI|nr:hypothetical protein FA13DRAFT_1797588 [Coprinellus micaceus]